MLGEQIIATVVETASAFTTVEREISLFQYKHGKLPEAVRVNKQFGALLLFELSKKLSIQACFPLFINEIPVVVSSSITGMLQCVDLTRKIKEDF